MIGWDFNSGILCVQLAKLPSEAFIFPLSFACKTLFKLWGISIYIRFDSRRDRVPKAALEKPLQGNKGQLLEEISSFCAAKATAAFL